LIFTTLSCFPNGTFRLKAASQKAKVQFEQGVVSPMNRKSAVAVSFLLLLLLSAPSLAVVVDSDLTDEEKEEIAIDEAVSNAEKRRLELILEKIGLHLLVDQPDEAADLFRKLAVVYPAQDDIAKSRITSTGYSVAYALTEHEQFREALKFADELLDLLGDDSILFHIRGIAFKGLGKSSDAREWTDRAFSYKFKDEEYRFQVAQFFFNQRDYGITGQELHRILYLESPYPEIRTSPCPYTAVLRRFHRGWNWELIANCYLFLGRISYQQRQYTESVERYRVVGEVLQQQKMLDLLPNIRVEIASAYMNAARDFEIRKEYEKELEVLQAGRSFVSSFAGLDNAIAAALFRLGKYDEAGDEYERAIDLFPQYPEAYVGFGDVLMELGYEDDAEEQYQQAIAIYTKGFQEAHADELEMAVNLNNLAWFYATHDRNLKEALELSAKSLELRPDQPEYLDTLAELYYKTGEIEKAQQYIKKAIEQDPPHVLYFQQQLEKFQSKPGPGAEKPGREDEKDD
jgi:tetratricopeptide (TPR) repeat protein